MMKTSLLFLGLSASVALACREREEVTKIPCKDDSIKGYFIVADGTGTFKDEWKQVRPFVNMFENIIEPHRPIWLMQFSSNRTFCNHYKSWECSGEQDHCKTGTNWKQLNSCPKEYVQYLAPGWTEKDFHSAAEAIFGIYQNGWTHPWQYIDECANKWINYKEQYGLKKEDKAVFVFMSDGENQDPDTKAYKEKAIASFEKANMKFIMVYKNTTTEGNYYDYRSYSRILNITTDVIDVPASSVVLNQELANRIVMKGCEGN